MDPLISVIIPVYNVEQYLRKCLESIINQTYKNLEIILIDDGSTDNSGKICDEYAKKDTRIQTIHKKNGGLSDARNCGLKKSTGDYIVFVDSDDWMDFDGIRYMFILSKKYDAPLVIGGTEKTAESTGKVLWSDFKECEDLQIMTKKESMRDVFINGCASWARLYKKEVHKDVFFPVGEINEDEAIVLQILERCNTIVKSSKIVYNYRFRENSITSTKFYKKKLDWCKHSKDNWDYIKKFHSEIEKEAKTRYINSIVWALNNMTVDLSNFAEDIYLFRKELKIYYKEYIKDITIPQKERLRVFFMCHFYYLYANIVKVLGKSYS